MRKASWWQNLMSDGPLLAAIFVLSFAGLIMVFSSTSHREPSTLFLKKQIFSFCLGLGAFFLCTQIPLSLLRKYSGWFLMACIFLLVLLLVPGFGVKAGGAIRWLKIAGIRIGQPSEITKLAIVIFLAHLLAKKQDCIRDLVRGFLPPVFVVLVIFALLMKQPDFGTSVMILAIMAIMLFVAGVRKTFLFGSMIVSTPIMYLMVSMKTYRWRRITAFLDPFAKENIVDGSYQLVQSLKAFASGGFWGMGLGGGKQKIGYLPEAHTDFIFAVLGEELGLTGSLFIILLFIFVVYRGLRISVRAVEPFYRFLAVGLTSLIALQGIINMGVVMGSLPTKGMPLPFISFARTSQIVILGCIGILMRIEAHNLMRFRSYSRNHR